MLERINKNIQSQSPVLDLHWAISDNFDFALLSQCTHLETLILSCNDAIKHLEWIEPLKNLKVLNLRSCTIRDASPLIHLHQLENLNLGFNFIHDFSVLGHLKKLRVLDLHASQISKIDFLKPLKHLERLYLSYNQIVDLSPLINLSALVDLELIHNPIQYIAPLKNLGQLRRVNCDISNLAYPPRWYIYLQHKNGPLADYQPMDELPQVQNIWQLICSDSPENQALAQQLALGQGWATKDFEMYQDCRPQKPEETDEDGYGWI